MKLFLASICAVTCLSGEPAKACDYSCQETEARLYAIEQRQADLQWQIDQQQADQIIYQEGF